MVCWSGEKVQPARRTKTVSNSVNQVKRCLPFFVTQVNWRLTLFMSQVNRCLPFFVTQVNWRLTLFVTQVRRCLPFFVTQVSWRLTLFVSQVKRCLPFVVTQVNWRLTLFVSQVKRIQRDNSGQPGRVQNQEVKPRAREKPREIRAIRPNQSHETRR